MSSAKPRPVAEINLEEFERRLRAAVAPQAGVEDPLVELTRLVDTIGAERAPQQRALELSSLARPKPKAELRLAPPSAPEPPTARPAPPPAAEAPPPLRPSFDAEDLDSSAIEPPAPSLAEPEEEAPRVQAAAPAPAPRARNWGMKIGGLIAAAAVMTGAVVVFKVGGRSHSGPPPLIMASTAPTRVPPPSQETVRTLNESGALLTRDTAQPTPTPPKLVDTPEAPVDLSARPQPSASPLPSPAASDAAPSPAASEAAPSPAASAAAPSPSPSATAQADASPVAPSSDTPIVATAAPKEPPVSPLGDDPSRVKTISVRPDGTLISSGYEAATAAETPAPALKPSDASGEAASPAVELPSKLSPPKSAAHVSKTATTAPADAGSGPAPAAPKPKKPKPVVAEPEVNSDDAQAPAPAGGGFAVQLAAPKSESEAKALIKRFQGRFAEALSGASLGVRKADRNGETIYRVRALGLSKAEAGAMCAKVKAAGGDCYVAKN